MSETPTRGPGRRNSEHRGVNIALQGGGAHGAYTWGVLDRLFEDDRIWIEGISGTSAGAMNAVVAAHGMHENGAEGARAHLEEILARGVRCGPVFARSEIALCPRDRGLVPRILPRLHLEQLHAAGGVPL